MNTPVPPTPPSSAALQTVTTSAGSTGTIVQSTVPQSTLQLGQTLAATVLSRAAPGQFIVQTDNGQLTLQTGANLLNGSYLNLQIQTAGARPQVLIVPLPGQTRPSTTPAATTAPAITSSLTQGSIAKATVLRPAAGVSAAAISTAAGAPVGPSGAAGLSGGNIQAAAPTSSTTPTTPATTSSATVAAASTRAPATGITPATSPTGLSPASTAPLPSGTSFNVRIISVTPPASGAAQPNAAAPGTFAGTVTGTTPTGQTIVQTSIGEIALSARATLPKGTQLTLQLAGSPQFPLATAGDTSSLLLSQQWDALRDAMAAIRSADPAVARNVAQQVLPQAGGPMTTGMLFFLSAMMTGDVRRWMGDEAMRVLQRTSGNILDRLRQDVGEMRRMATEPAGQEWRSYLIPILVGQDLQQLKFFIRGEKDAEDENGSDKNRDIRFVIEVEFSKLGPFQFDGLTRDKNVDLMVRTRDTLAENMRDDIRAIFANALSALGFSGTINFQRSVNFELNPTQEVHATQSGFTV